MTGSASEEPYRPRVSAIVPNWNRMDDLREALEAIQAQTYPIEEIIVLDNNSTDGSRDMVENDFPEVNFIQSPHNIYVEILNIGAKTAHGDVVLHQDNDGVLAPDAVERMVEVLAEDPRIAVVHCKNLWYDTGEVFDPMRWFTEEEHNSDGVYDVPSFHGCGVLMRRDVLEEIGYLEPGMHLWERCVTAKATDHGYRVVYHPPAVIRHKMSREYRDPGRRLYVNMKGGWWFLARFYPPGKALKKAFLYLAYFFLCSVKRNTFKDFFRGIVDTLIGLPEILRRREVVSPRAIQALESKPYELSMITYGSFDTVRSWFEGRKKT